MKKFEIKTGKPAASEDKWVGVKGTGLIKLTVDIPAEMHMRLRATAVEKSTETNRVYLRDVVMMALEEYFNRNPVNP